MLCFGWCLIHWLTDCCCFVLGAKQESKLRLNSPTVSAGPLASKTTAGANHHSISNSNNSGSLPLQSNSMSPQEISHLENSYRHLIEEKKELKKALKHFDDEFLAKNKRMPKRQDKEVVYLTAYYLLLWFMGAIFSCFMLSCCMLLRFCRVFVHCTRSITR